MSSFVMVSPKFKLTLTDVIVVLQLLSEVNTISYPLLDQEIDIAQNGQIGLAEVISMLQTLGAH